MAREVIVAKYGGFCFGVKKAVDMAFTAADEHKENTEKIYSYGELIHNEQVNQILQDKGVDIIDDISELKGRSVILRSHGVEKEVYDIAKKNNIKVIDTTCTFVKRVHKIVAEHSANAYHIVIAGDKNHPEVKGIMSWAESCDVIADVSDIEKIKTELPICLVAQTTLNTENWKMLKTALENKFEKLVIFDTICSATEKRQKEVLEMTKKVDFIYVVGGKKSSNTRKLYEISQKNGIKSKIIQDFSQINVKNIEKYDRIGVVAGASTPDWVIEQIVQKLKFEGEVST